ncbi:MAG: V/A-type H+/Na+-transporting ATPase subunit [Candidatus Atribacteria bacterium]|nr:V/A-type H+/Na+-transporting ATPase subunit [Candidatus Atribacteria bacterium]
MVTNFGLIGKISALIGDLLTDEDFQNLLGEQKVTGIASYLKNTPGYQPYLSSYDIELLHRRDLELILNQSNVDILLRLRNFSQAEETTVIDFILLGFEVENLKLVTKFVLLEAYSPLEEVEKRLYQLANWSKVDFGRLLRYHTFEELLSALSGTHYYQLFQAASSRFVRGPNLYSIENSLDYWYFSRLAKGIERFSSSAKKLAWRFFGIQGDLLNVELIYRLRFIYHLAPENVYGLTVPLFYYFDPDRARDLTNTSQISEFMGYLTRSPYRKVFWGWEESAEILDEIFERRTLSYRYQTAKNFVKSKLSSLSMLLGYSALKDFEVRDLITVIEDVRYSLDARLAERYFIRPVEVVSLSGS